MEDKMAAGAFWRPTNYGWDGLLKQYFCSRQQKKFPCQDWKICKALNAKKLHIRNFCEELSLNTLNIIVYATTVYLSQ